MQWSIWTLLGKHLTCIWLHTCCTRGRSQTRRTWPTRSDWGGKYINCESFWVLMCQRCVRTMIEAIKQDRMLDFWQPALLTGSSLRHNNAPSAVLLGKKEALRFYFKFVADIWHLTSLACVDLVFVLLWVLTSARAQDLVYIVWAYA